MPCFRSATASHGFERCWSKRLLQWISQLFTFNNICKQNVTYECKGTSPNWGNFRFIESQSVPHGFAKAVERSSAYLWDGYEPKRPLVLCQQPDSVPNITFHSFRFTDTNSIANPRDTSGPPPFKKSGATHHSQGATHHPQGATHFAFRCHAFC